jgi:hypothetical protein
MRRCDSGYHFLRRTDGWSCVRLQYDATTRDLNPRSEGDCTIRHRVMSKLNEQASRTGAQFRRADHEP